MFINTISKNDKTGNIRELKNIDYYKRYIIIEVPEDGNIKSFANITIINISSSTGRGLIGRFTEKERRQNYTVYYARGHIFNFIPEIITKEVSKCINFDSVISVFDSSYSAHLYNLGKPRLSELSTITSYNDYYDESFNRKADVLETLPFPKFYNFEHHILNEDVQNSMIPLSVDLSYNNSLYIKLRELVDDHTFIFVSKNSNFNSMSKNEIDSFEWESEIPIETIITSIIGPVTNLFSGLLVNELDFCYDMRTDNHRLSRLKYKTDHKLPNELYMSQITGNYVTQFEQEMEFIKEYSRMSFILFVHCTLGNIRIRVLSHNPIKGYIYKDFNMFVGAIKYIQHKETINWIKTPLF